MHHRRRWALLGSTTTTWATVIYSTITGWGEPVHETLVGVAVAATVSAALYDALTTVAARNCATYRHEIDRMRHDFDNLRDNTIASGIAKKYGIDTDAAVRVPEPEPERQLAPLHHIHERRISIGGDDAIAGIEAGYELDAAGVEEALRRRPS